MTVTNFPPPHFCGWMFNAYAVLSVVLKMQNTNFSIYHQNTYTSQQRKRHKDVFKYVFMLKPYELFIVIYANDCVKRSYPHKTNNNIFFRDETIA